MKAPVVWLLTGLTLSISSFGCAKRDVQLDGSELPSTTPPEQQASTAKLAESQFRKLIVESSLPAYPAADGKARVTGPVVVGVYIGPDGSLRSTQVLESPSDAIARAVTDALKTWRFVGFSPTGGPMGAKSKLTFYFEIVDRVPTVRLASVAPIPQDIPKALPETLDLSALDELRQHARLQIIDIRQRDDFARGHLHDARNIPSDEISSRVLGELRPDLAVVIDCRSVDIKLCNLSSNRLSQLGFVKIYELIPAS